MSYYVGIPLIFLLTLVEVSVLPLFTVSGLQPNLILVLLIAWLMLRGATEAFILIPFAGLFMGMVDGAPLGTALLALSPLFLMQELRGAHLRESGLVMSLLFTVIMTIAYHLIYLLVFTLAGQNGSWLEAMTRVVVPTAFLNAVLLLPVYLIMSLASQSKRRPTYA